MFLYTTAGIPLGIVLRCVHMGGVPMDRREKGLDMGGQGRGSITLVLNH